MSAASAPPAASALETAIGYRFARPDLLELALCHRSFANERGLGEHNERLEFLGDAVLGAVVGEWLYETMPDRPEGELAKLKSLLVSEPLLAGWARDLELGRHLRLGTAEDRAGGRDKRALLADALEAVFGAVHLDGGFVAVRAVIRPLLGARRDDLADLAAAADSKTELQEEAQRRGWPLPVYRVFAEEGPEHEKEFAVECWLLGEIAGTGRDTRKKRAEQRAAAVALERLRGGWSPQG